MVVGPGKPKVQGRSKGLSLEEELTLRFKPDFSTRGDHSSSLGPLPIFFRTSTGYQSPSTLQRGSIPHTGS